MGNSWLLSRSQALHGVPRRQAARSMTLPDNRSPLASNNLKSPSTTCPHPGTAYSKPPYPRRASELTAMYGVKYFARTTLLQVDTPVIDSPKNAAASFRHNMNLLTKQRAPRSQKRAGAEETHYPSVHETLGRCPSRNLSDNMLKIDEKSF